jgi:protein TonB
MPNTNYSTLSFTDIVFEGRNKSYGAYELRNSYNQTMVKALVRAVVIFVMLFAVPIGLNKLIGYFFPAVKVIPVSFPPIDFDEVFTQPKAADPVKPEASPKQSGGKTVKSGQYVISDNDVDTLPKTDTMTNVNFGKITGGSGIGSGGSDTPAGTGTGIPTGDGGGPGGNPSGTTDEKAEDIVEFMPEFPGGSDAMIKFLAKRITYTSQALNADRQGKVYIQFVVNKDGSLSNLEVIKGVGYGLDEKALEAAKQMPNWSPGRNGKHTVKVRCVIPVEFKLAN